MVKCIGVNVNISANCFGVMVHKKLEGKGFVVCYCYTTGPEMCLCVECFCLMVGKLSVLKSIS